MKIMVRLTEQQVELIDASVDAPAWRRTVRRWPGSRCGRPRAESSRRPHPRPSGRPWRWCDDALDDPPTRTVVAEHVPRARHRQGVRGARPARSCASSRSTGDQCVDLNVFNLHDYREFLHVGRTRTLHGINPGAGDFLWSAPPRERALMYLLTDTARINDTLFPRCSANMYESMHGFAEHTNCADIQAEAQREYGLTPDDVHDSFNLFMATRVIDGHARDRPAGHRARRPRRAARAGGRAGRARTSAATTS